jgi:LysM repeat protein
MNRFIIRAWLYMLLIALVAGAALVACSSSGRSPSPTWQRPSAPDGRPTQRVERRKPFRTSQTERRDGSSQPKTSVLQKTLTIPTTPRTIIHEVAPMETIWRLSKMYGVSMQSIYRANGLRKGDPIYIGQELVIPDSPFFKNVIPLYPKRRWSYIVIHHTATDVGNATLIHKSHHDRGFWKGLGYHFIIDNGTLGKGDGQIEASPRWIKQQNGAHCTASKMNYKGIGIGLVGNFNRDLPTENQIRSLAQLVKALSEYYRIPPTRIVGHGEVPGAATDCPGHRFPWAALKRYLADL